MQIEAIYDSGTLLLPAIRLKHSRLTLQVIIPDDEIVDEQADLVATNTANEPVGAGALPILDEIDAIIGPWRDQLRKLAPISKDELRRLRDKEREEQRSGR
jgi:hypothetical protein